MNRTRRGIVVATAVALVAGALTQIAPTRATWVDPVTFAAPMSAGTWEVATPPTNPDINDGGITEGNESTEITNIVWNNVQPQSFCTVVNVTGTSSTPARWQIDVDLTAVPFRGLPAASIGVQGGNPTFAGNTLTITGKENPGAPFDPWNNNTPITNTRVANVQICNNYGPSPQGNPGWYTVQVQPLTNQWNKTDACVRVTATTTQTSLVANPFFYGWTTTLDMTAAIAYMRSLGGTPDVVLFSPAADGQGVLETTPPPGGLSSTYQLKSGHSLAIRAQGSGRESATVTACAHDWG